MPFFTKHHVLERTRTTRPLNAYCNIPVFYPKLRVNYLYPILDPYSFYHHPTFFYHNYLQSCRRGDWSFPNIIQYATIPLHNITGYFHLLFIQTTLTLICFHISCIYLNQYLPSISTNLYNYSALSSYYILTLLYQKFLPLRSYILFYCMSNNHTILVLILS